MTLLVPNTTQNIVDSEMSMMVAGNLPTTDNFQTMDLPEDHSMVMFPVRDELSIGRPRKNSESFREIEAVDSSQSMKFDTVRGVSSRSSTITSITEEPVLTKPKRSLAVRRRSLVAQVSADPLVVDWKKLPVATAEPLTILSSHSALDAVRTVQATRILSETSEPDRAGLICIKVFKPSKEAKLGLRVVPNSDGNLKLGELTGPMAESPASAGDDLLRINGQNVVAWSAKNTLAHLRESWGWISLIVRPRNGNPSLRQASVLKSSVEDRLGVTFQQLEEENLSIHKLNAAGLLGDGCTIEKDQIVESINDIPCVSVDEVTATSIVESAPSLVHLRTRLPEELDDFDHEIELERYQPEDVQPTEECIECASEVLTCHDSIFDEEHVEADLVSVAFWKSSKVDRLGITLIKIDGTLHIQKLSGLAAESILREGMSVIALNDKLAARMTRKEAMNFLKSQEGSVRILARNPHGSSEVVQAMIYRQPSSANKSTGVVGVSFKGAAGRQLNICQVRVDGMFANSCLNVGDSVLSINGVPCRQARPRDAVNLVRESKKSVIILAKANPKACVSVAILGSSSRIYT